MKAKEKLDPETEDLIREWSIACSIDFTQAKVLFFVFKQAMLIHLGAKQKSIDFGFAMLHPSPFRRNYKSYLLQRYPYLGRWIRGRSLPERERVFRESGFREEFHRSILLAVRNGLVYFNLEVVPKKDWWLFSLSAQRRMASMLGPAGYCRAIGKHIHHAKEKFVEAYLSFLRQIAIPCGGVVSGKYHAGKQVLTEFRERRKIKPATAPVFLFPPYHPNDPAELQPSEQQIDSGAQASRLLQVSTEESEALDVRDGGDKPQISGGGD